MRDPSRAGVRRILLTASAARSARATSRGTSPTSRPTRRARIPTGRWAQDLRRLGDHDEQGPRVIGRTPVRRAASAIDVVVHPQSVIHSLVEYVDGSVLAQLSYPDMPPIAHALAYPRAHRRRRGGTSVSRAARGARGGAGPRSFACLHSPYAALAPAAAAPASSTRPTRWPWPRSSRASASPTSRPARRLAHPHRALATLDDAPMPRERGALAGNWIDGGDRFKQ